MSTKKQTEREALFRQALTDDEVAAIRRVWHRSISQRQITALNKLLTYNQWLLGRHRTAEIPRLVERACLDFMQECRNSPDEVDFAMQLLMHHRDELSEPDYRYLPLQVCAILAFVREWKQGLPYADARVAAAIMDFEGKINLARGQVASQQKGASTNQQNAEARHAEWQRLFNDEWNWMLEDVEMRGADRTSKLDVCKLVANKYNDNPLEFDCDRDPIAPRTVYDNVKIPPKP